MAGTRVFALDFRAGISGLLDDQIRGMAFHDGFDVRVFVAADHYEARYVRRDPVIVRRRKFDRL